MKKEEFLVSGRKTKRIEVAGILNDRLEDSIDLMFQSRQVWLSVNEAKSGALQERCDKVYSDAGAYVDLLAERIDQMGDNEPGTTQSATANSGFIDYSLEITNSQKNVPDLTFVITCYCELLSRSIARSTELGDTETAEIFARISHSAAMNLWLTSKGTSLGEGKRNPRDQGWGLEHHVCNRSDRKNAEVLLSRRVKLEGIAL